MAKRFKNFAAGKIIAMTSSQITFDTGHSFPTTMEYFNSETPFIVSVWRAKKYIPFEDSEKRTIEITGFVSGDIYQYTTVEGNPGGISSPPTEADDAYYAFNTTDDTFLNNLFVSAQVTTNTLTLTKADGDTVALTLPSPDVTGLAKTDLSNVDSDLDTAEKNAVKSKLGITDTDISGKADTDLSNLDDDLTGSEQTTIRTKLGITETDVSNKADKDLSNVDNDLSNTEKSTIRGKIGAGTSNFDGAYSSLSGRPTIPQDTTVFRGDWSGGTQYDRGDIVVRNNDVYICITSNNDTTFPTAKFIQLDIGSPTDITNLSISDDVITVTRRNGTTFTLTIDDAVAKESTDTEAETGGGSGIDRMTARQTKKAIDAQAVTPKDLEGRETDRWGSHQDFSPDRTYLISDFGFTTDTSGTPTAVNSVEISAITTGDYTYWESTTLRNNSDENNFSLAAKTPDSDRESGDIIYIRSQTPYKKSPYLKLTLSANMTKAGTGNAEYRYGRVSVEKVGTGDAGSSEDWYLIATDTPSTLDILLDVEQVAGAMETDAENANIDSLTNLPDTSIVASDQLLLQPKGEPMKKTSIGDVYSNHDNHHTGISVLTGYTYITIPVGGNSAAGSVHDDGTNISIKPLNADDSTSIKAKILSGKKIRLFVSDSRYVQYVTNGGINEAFGVLSVPYVSAEKETVGTALTNNLSISLEVENNIPARVEIKPFAFKDFDEFISLALSGTHSISPDINEYKLFVLDNNAANITITAGDSFGQYLWIYNNTSSARTISMTGSDRLEGSLTQKIPVGTLWKIRHIATNKWIIANYTTHTSDKSNAPATAYQYVRSTGGVDPDSQWQAPVSDLSAIETTEKELPMAGAVKKYVDDNTGSSYVPKVKHAQYTGSAYQLTAFTWTTVPASGGELTMTPNTSSSKFLIKSRGITNGVDAAAQGDIRIQRKIGTGNWTTLVTQIKAFFSETSGFVMNLDYGAYEDSPNTTSDVSYRVQWRRGNLSNNSNSNSPSWSVQTVFITVTELV